MEKTDMYIVKISIFISEEQRKKLKIYSALTSIKMNELIRLALEEYFQNHPIKEEEIQNLVKK